MTDHAAHIRSALDMTETWDTYTQGVSKEYRDAALAALDALVAERDEALADLTVFVTCLKHSEACAEAAEKERDALAEVAADSNEREKLLEAELARLIEMHERIANLDWPADDFHLARAISRAAIAPKEEAWGSLDKLTGSTALGKEPTA